MCCLHYQVFHAKQPWRKLVSGFSFACNKYPPQFTDDKSNDSSMREGIPLDALNWFGRGYELHTPKSVGREGSKAWALSVVPHFSLSPPHVAFSRVGWFSRALTFRSLYYPWGKMGDYSYSRYKSTALNGRLFYSPCVPGIYLLRKIKVELGVLTISQKISEIPDGSYMVRSLFGNSHRKLRSTFWGSPFIPVGTNQTECCLSSTNFSVPSRFHTHATQICPFFGFKP